MESSLVQVRGLPLSFLCLWPVHCVSTMCWGLLSGRGSPTSAHTIPHGNHCPFGQFSCRVNLLSQQTHVCYEPQPGMHSTVGAAGEHHLSLCCPQQGVLGLGFASVQGLQSTWWVAVYTPRAHCIYSSSALYILLKRAVYTPRACWCVARARLATLIGPLFDNGSRLPSAIIQPA